MKTRSKTSQICLNAAKLLEKSGWCQGITRDDEGRHCLSGALNQVGSGDPWTSFPEENDIARWFDENRGGMVSWNDGPGRSKIRVIQALQRAAEDLR